MSRPLFEADQLQSLHAAIRQYLPDWSQNLRVAVRGKTALVGNDGDLCAAINAHTTSRHEAGLVDLIGGDEGLAFFLSHSNALALADGNQVALEILDLPTVEGQAVATWVREFFESLSVRLPTRFAAGYQVSEYGAKNLHDDATGCWALKAGLDGALPGLYWLNYFGKVYCDLIGRDRLLSAPAKEVKAVGDGVLIALDASPRAWTTPQYQQQEQAVIEHLGKQYFFSRHEPDRKTIGPDFEALARKPAET